MEHPLLGHLEYEEDLNWYTAKVTVDGRTADLRIHCGSRTDSHSEPPALAHAVRFVATIDRLCQTAKECAVRDLLGLKNDDWRGDDEPEVDVGEFKRLMEIEGIVVHGDGSAEFYYQDGDLFWGHAILVYMRADGRFGNASLAG